MIDYSTIALRAHQRRALDLALQICGGDTSDLGPGNKCIPVAVVPGGGKSILASVIGHVFLTRGEVDAILWLSPNTTLCAQVADTFKSYSRDFSLTDNLQRWIKTIAKTGQATLALENKRNKKGARCAGSSITNGGLLANLPTVLNWMDGKRVLVIADEVHHFSSFDADNREGDEDDTAQRRRVGAWSDALNKVLDKAAWSVVMTGTMFRNDGLPVAGVRYDDQKRAIVLIRYTRHQALAERALKRIEVNTSDGETEMKFHGYGQVARARLTQAKRTDVSKILGHCIDNNGWRWATIERACSHFDAQYNIRGFRSQMLVICAGVKHAVWAAKKLRERYKNTGVRIVLAHSTMTEDDVKEWGKPDLTLARFRAHTEGDILVTVDMAGEGFDAPWIDHLVLLNKVRSKVKLDQYVNRATRINRQCNLPWEEQWAFIYCPADPGALEFFSEYFSDVGETYSGVPPEMTERIPSDKPPREQRLAGGIPVTFIEGPTQILDAAGSQSIAPEMNRYADELAKKFGLTSLPRKAIIDLINETRRAGERVP